MMGSRINRHSAVVALMNVPIMHLRSFCLALALQRLMQPILCGEQKVTIWTRNLRISLDSANMIRLVFMGLKHN